MAFKGKTIAILLGVAAGTAFASYAISKKGKKIRQFLTSKDEVKNEMPSNDKPIKEIKEVETYFI